MLKHDEIIRNYGLSDPRLEESWNELTGAYAVKTFKVMMAMVLNVVEKARTDYNVDHSGKITSKSPIDLFKLMNTVVDSYSLCKTSLVLNSLVGLCYKLTNNFVTEYRTIVDHEIMDTEVFVAITNASIEFVGGSRDFVHRVKVLSDLPIEEIQLMYSYSH